MTSTSPAEASDGPPADNRAGTADIGVVGLAVMGQNLVLNLADNGFTVAAHNRSSSRIDELMDRVEPSHDVRPALHLADLVALLSRPRIVLLMVQAGAAVDQTIDALVPLLTPGDVVVDGGNSRWTDSERRQRLLADNGIHFVGAGVSGGEEGARHGPSIMPGGDAAAWPALRPLLEAVAARAEVDDQPCVSWLGPGGAGHFVKMIHNGIEYGDMQVLAEAHTLLRAAGYEPARQAELFAEWNRGRLRSYLVEITAEILAATDDNGADNGDDNGAEGGPLIDVILDAAGQKGTGRWTVNAAMDTGQPMMLVAEAVGARMVSALVETRAAVAARYPDQPPAPTGLDLDDVEAALHTAKIISYAQGFMVLDAASRDHGWDLDLAAVARLWRGGCIIRAAFLDDIAAAFTWDESVASEGVTTNLILTDTFAPDLAAGSESLRRVVVAAMAAGIPVPALASALAFFDGMRTARGSGHLIQAQRDYFGAHTYERLDRPRGEFFHTDWIGSGGAAVSGSYRA